MTTLIDKFVKVINYFFTVVIRYRVFLGPGNGHDQIHCSPIFVKRAKFIVIRFTRKRE